MLTDENFEDLEKKGYTVVPNVATPVECDEAIRQYQEWLTQFTRTGSWPHTFNGIINWYNTGHMVPTWEMRLRAKKVFAQIWKTEKLLTSFDAISIGRPPEDGKETFEMPGKHWLHTDQIASRLGLHAYQGALYLEEQCKDDWTFHVLEKSHKHMDMFYHRYPHAAAKAEPVGHYTLKKDEIDFYIQSGAHRIIRVPVPKGGMALWDSRLIHANARPVLGRKHPGRWRFTNFISMTPAIWATDEDIKLHKEAYENAMMTSHWSSTKLQPYISKARQDVNYPTELPEIAQTDEAKQLSGVISYDFKDGKPNGDGYIPKWKTPVA